MEIGRRDSLKDKEEKEKDEQKVADAKSFGDFAKKKLTEVAEADTNLPVEEKKEEETA